MRRRPRPSGLVVVPGTTGPARRGGMPMRRITLILVAAAVCLLVSAVAGVSQLQDRARRVEAAHREAATLARVLAEQTDGEIRATDLVLLSIAEGLRRDPNLPEHDPAFEDSLRHLLGHLPAVRALFVIGPDGFILQDSDRDTPRRNLADRDYFEAQIQPGRGLFIGQPLISRSVGTWFIGLSRRVETPQGGFAGVAAAALDVRYFEHFYGELGVGAGDVITLTTRDGTLVARQPRADQLVGERLTGPGGRSPLREALAQSPAGSFEAPSAVDGERRIFAYRALDDRPLVVLVGLSLDRVLAPWRRGVAAAAAVATGAFALALLLAWAAMRHARGEAEAKMRLAEAEKLEALGRVTGGVAHDFNNLLQAMLAALRLLGKRVRDDPDATQLIEQGLAAIERGRGLVGQLLGLARPQPVEARAVDVNALLSGMTTLLSNAAAPKARVKLDLAPDLPPCWADPSRLDAAILNLVVNARDALPPERAGPETIRISTEICEERIVSPDGRRLEPGHFVCVTVRDRGNGMPPEVRRRALEPFFTTKGEGGTGLGLAQVYAFVRELGGDVRIDSEPGAGTAVHLYLPIHEPGAAAADGGSASKDRPAHMAQSLAHAERKGAA